MVSELQASKTAATNEFRVTGIAFYWRMYNSFDNLNEVISFVSFLRSASEIPYYSK
jgi:hypothetical protein